MWAQGAAWLGMFKPNQILFVQPVLQPKSQRASHTERFSTNLNPEKDKEVPLLQRRLVTERRDPRLNSNTSRVESNVVLMVVETHSFSSVL